ncbi:nuclear pore complex protein Nup153-like isoform X2 [Mytilus californianus]|uniref:nuclear pore complex protein Nup153-like isoform X2 n=1 Tax=Mytilus californianus TaxID=6549 RepID=UPI0022476F5C|nr:nuclear pore complex protein Nup153-like isoform X2 [Mytilus californianus]
MSEEAGGKIKSKRHHGSNKPYERRKSLLGKVKDLITPSWLSSFVNNKKSDETTEKDDTNSKVPASSPIHGRTKQQNDTKPAPVFVPLDKRNGTPSQLMAPPQSTVIAHTRSGEVGPSFKADQFPLQAGFTSSQLPLIPEKMYEHHYHHVDNDDNISDRSDHSKSTSGCSSMIPHPPSTVLKDRVTLELNESDIDNIKDKLLVDSNDKLPPRLGKYLTWTAQYNTKRPKKPALIGKPSFDVSLFGSPVPGNRSALSHDRLNESAFYPGRTTFGGASSQRRQSLNTTAPYVSSPFPVRQKMKAKPLNNSFAGTATTSGTARKILETLEKMTTPLGDARKIPVDDTVMQSLSSSFSFTPSVYRRPTRHSIGAYMNSSRELQTPNRGPPLQRVSTPGSASIAANLQRFVPNRESTETTGSYQLPGSSQKDPGMSSINTQGGKMKSKKFTTHHVASRKDDEEDEPYEMPQLRTEFTLPVKDMPTFNFNMPKSTPQRTTKDLSSQQYTFSSPIQKMAVTPTDTPTGPPKMDFKFSSPIQQGDGSASPSKSKSVTFNLGDDNDIQMKYNYKSSTVSTSSLTASPVSQGFSKPVSQTSSNNSSPSSGGFKVASELKSGSVMDILGKSGTAQKKSPEVAPKNDSLAKFAVKGWTCDICLLSNKDDSDKCVACTSPRPGAKPSSKNDSLAKFAVKGWTCDICLVSNKDDSDKCVACTSPRPGAKPSVPKNDSLAKFAGKGWTCNVCLVSNKDDAEKCVACAEPKPGLKKSTSKSAGGDSLQSIFKKPSGNWDCDVCLVPNKGDVTKCIACETPRPGTQPSSSGGLKIAPGAFSGQSGFILPVGSNSNSNMSNSGFSLGGDSKSASGSGFKFSGEITSAGSGFKFGDSSVKLSDDSDKQSSNVKSDNKEKGGFVFGKSNSFSPQKSALTGTGFKFGENKPDEINKSGFLSQNSLSGTKDKSSASGFMLEKTSSECSDKTDGVSKLNSDSTVILDSTKISVTTSTVATTGLAFNSKSDSETKTLTTPGGINFGQSVSATGQKPANGGFVFGQSSNNDIKTTSVNSIFGTSSSNKSDSSNSIFGSDPKTSINSFTGTNNSGFSFNKTEDKKSEPSFNNQSTKVSPNLKRSRDDETGPGEKKKPFAAPSTASSGLFQFGVKSTASTNAAPSSAFGQNKDSKPTAFAAPSFNFGGAAPTNSTTGFNAVPQTTTSSIFNSTGSSISSGTVFGSAATVTSSSTGSSFVFGASSANPATSSVTFGSTPQTSSLFSNSKSSTPTFGTSTSIPSFGSPISTVGGFGSTATGFGSSSTNPQFGASQPSSTPAFGTQQTSTPTFGTPQTTAPAFGTPHTSVPAFGAPQSSIPSFGTPQKPSGPVFGATQNASFGPTPVTSSTPGGFNFSAAPSFNFGQSSNTPQQPAAPSAAVFQFGGPKQAEAPQQPTVPAGGFNFGQAASTPAGTPYNFSAAPTPAATPSFGAGGFGQPSTPQQSGTGMFNIGAGSTDNRKIKKAVRKIRR